MIDLQKIWNSALEQLSISIMSVTYDVWIKTLEPICVTDSKLILVTPTEKARVLINKNYLSLINATVSNIHTALSGVVIITDELKDSYLKKQASNIDNQEIVKSDVELEVPSFTAKYTFYSFVIGSSNKFAAAAARAVAENPGSKHNPLFLWGGVGLGKTHLMHAIGNYIRKNSPTTRIQYVTTNDFTNELVDSIEKSKKNRDVNTEFREKYRNVDVLMIDDIQFLVNRSGTQEAVFNLFNDLYQNGKQIILTSDRPPKEISTLEERLRSRFEWGIMADIGVPDIETRIAILRSKANEEGYNVTEDVLTYIADICKSNVREMEGLLSKVVLYSNLLGHGVADINVAQEALNSYHSASNEVLTVDHIIKATCHYFNISKEDLIGKKRNKEIVEPRMICIYVINNLLSMPLSAIGEAMGGRDHTTIMHSRDLISQKMQKNETLRNQINDIKNSILNK